MQVHIITFPEKQVSDLKGELAISEAEVHELREDNRRLQGRLEWHIRTGGCNLQTSGGSAAAAVQALMDNNNCNNTITSAAVAENSSARAAVNAHHNHHHH